METFEKIELFLASSLICIGAVLVYKYNLNCTTELDLVSHFFGGVSVTLVILYLSDKITFLRNSHPLLILITCILAFEMTEYFTAQYPYDSIKIILTPEGKLDTLLDIIFSMIGGLVVVRFRNKLEGSKNEN